MKDLLLAFMGNKHLQKVIVFVVIVGLVLLPIKLMEDNPSGRTAYIVAISALAWGGTLAGSFVAGALYAKNTLKTGADISLQTLADASRVIATDTTAVSAAFRAGTQARGATAGPTGHLLPPGDDWIPDLRHMSTVDAEYTVTGDN